jgi:hypothetical protein
MVTTLDHFEWGEHSSHGYVILDVDQARARGEWWHVDTVLERCRCERMAAAYDLPRGETALRRGRSGRAAVVSATGLRDSPHVLLGPTGDGPNRLFE